MPQDLILAIDQGTTGSTCLLIDAQQRIVARATQEFAQHFPAPGHVEHEPEEIWESIVGAIEQVVRGNDFADSIRCIGITNQRETCLVWERQSGKPIHRAIVWQDRRTAADCETRRQNGEEADIQNRTGLCLDPYFSGTKLRWLLERSSVDTIAASEGKYAAGTIDTYVLWRLTGGRVHATEPSNACRTLLWNLRAKAGSDDWDPDLLQQFHIPRAILPDVLPSDATFGHTRGVPNLPDGIPICAILGDQQAALFGQNCFDAGMAKCTYGTGAFALLQTGDSFHLSQHRLLTSVAWQRNNRSTYCLEGSAFMAGALVAWLRDGLGIIQQSADVEALARQVKRSDGVVMVPAHAGLGAPHWRSEARGMISGLTRGTTAAHIARATLEGIAFSVLDLLEAMQSDTQTPLSELRVDGGAAANDLLMQMQSDFAQTPLVRPQNLETTALGAGLLAGLSAGLWTDLKQLQTSWSAERRFMPGSEHAHYDELRNAYRRAVALA